MWTTQTDWLPSTLLLTVERRPCWRDWWAMELTSTVPPGRGTLLSTSLWTARTWLYLLLSPLIYWRYWTVLISLTVKFQCDELYIVIRTSKAINLGMYGCEDMTQRVQMAKLWQIQYILLWQLRLMCYRRRRNWTSCVARTSSSLKWWWVCSWWGRGPRSMLPTDSASTLSLSNRLTWSNCSHATLLPSIAGVFSIVHIVRYSVQRPARQ